MCIGWGGIPWAGDEQSYTTVCFPGVTCYCTSAHCCCPNFDTAAQPDSGVSTAENSREVGSS
jgi:hypothetical protein